MNLPVRTSLNNPTQIKKKLMDSALKKVPAALQPLSWQVTAYLKSDLTDEERKMWYIRVAKYRNNFER